MTVSKAPIVIRMGPTNAYLLKLAHGYLLVDTSFPGYFAALQKNLDRSNVALDEIKCLLLTHAHDDHAGLVAELKARTRCRIIAHERSIEALKTGRIAPLGRFVDKRASFLMGLYSWMKRRDFTFPPVALDEGDLFVAGEDDSILRSMGLAGRIIVTPGHAQDCLSVVLSNGDALVGDACMSAFRFLRLRPPVVDDFAQVLQSWQKIIASGSRTIYPGHGRPFPVDRLIQAKERFSQHRQV